MSKILHSKIAELQKLQSSEISKFFIMTLKINIRNFLVTIEKLELNFHKLFYKLLKKKIIYFYRC